MKRKLAIFDLDGTLFNTDDVNFEAYSSALIHYGYDLEYEHFCNNCNGLSYKKFLPPIINNNDLLEPIHKLKKELYSKNLEKAKINQHLFNMIELIKNSYYIAIVTTASRQNCLDILEHFKKRELFDLIVAYEDIKNVKPNPEGFIKAMQFFDIEPKETIIFEDSDVGMQAARNSEASVFIVDKF
ncbi:HAD family hydrolase [Clostridium butyricum]|uniref:HAD family hydrolase n=1 Tax=Clostridium butyricum TaxID=1492 RepID=UPI0013D0A3E6|nr:HAD-IA family hydrolase [Clostridium butyricum]MCQ2016309.1 HAD family hydrolase [Clostridium butyricum]MCQ2023377.1 HAD family hydrolase [Clostridium butyricum]NFB70534.1 haloacid dehalogenase [Clostridium butyricum]NFB90232.1 haloacid dehalogenase [Clostridium butyricum]UTY54595.1 HAD-IA family hydrolase [Clostridium butyricum]